MKELRISSPRLSGAWRRGKGGEAGPPEHGIEGLDGVKSVDKLSGWEESVE